MRHANPVLAAAWTGFLFVVLATAGPDHHRKVDRLVGFTMAMLFVGVAGRAIRYVLASE